MNARDRRNPPASETGAADARDMKKPPASETGAVDARDMRKPPASETGAVHLDARDMRKPPASKTAWVTGGVAKCLAGLSHLCKSHGRLTVSQPTYLENARTADLAT